MYGTVLVVGLQRTSETADAQSVFTTIFDPVYEQDVQLNVITGSPWSPPGRWRDSV